MQLTRNFKRRNVAYARYQRALVELVLLPHSLWQEAVQPTGAHVLRIAAIAAMGLLAGWMHREAVRWWTETPVPDA